MFGIAIAQTTDYDTLLPTGEGIVVSLSPCPAINIVKSRFTCDVSLSQRGFRYWKTDRLFESYQRDEGYTTRFLERGW